ncbi:hypothetical protein [Nocardia sp. CNY236]|uniref:hypothetical protein n=1 Tax=Nocardia sp. CNY236 TaxID=1169152 RepID=UPI0004004A4D|nr:hypothetical protein [Nocardia sp. CNY236]
MGPYRYGDNQIPVGDRALLIAREILDKAGKGDITEHLVPSRYADGTRGDLASHCASCGAVQGNFYVHQEALNALIDSAGDIQILDLLADGTCDAGMWSKLVADEWLEAIFF